MNTPITIEEMLELKIHDTVKIENGVQAVRVPGGWIYYLQTAVDTTPSETFVPEPVQLDYAGSYLKTRHNAIIRGAVLAILGFAFGSFITYVINK